MSALGRKIHEYGVAECDCLCQSGIIRVLVNLMTRDNHAKEGGSGVLCAFLSFVHYLAQENRPWPLLRFKGLVPFVFLMPGDNVGAGDFVWGVLTCHAADIVADS